MHEAATSALDRGQIVKLGIPRSGARFFPHRRLPISAVVFGAVVVDWLLAIAVAFAIGSLCLHHTALKQYVLASVGLTGIVLILFQTHHLYKIELISDIRRAVPRIARTWTFAFLAFATVCLLAKNNEYSRIWIVSWYFTGLGVLIVERWAFAKLFASFIKSRRIVHSVVLVGTSTLAAHLIEKLENNRYGVRVEAVFDDAPNPGGTYCRGIEVKGGIDDLLQYHKTHAIDSLIFTTPITDRERLHRTIQQLSVQPFNIRILPGELALQAPRSWFAPLGEVPGIQLMVVRDRPIARWGFMVKSLFDCIAAMFALILLSPVLIACAVGVKLSSRGPVLFRQKRVGYKGCEFDIFKFRTMHHAAGGSYKPTARGDSRIFKFGGFLRKLSLDELPQLFNVVKGDMSLVGPRPHMLNQEVEGRDFFEAVNEYAGRHRVKPGITGWAQVNGWRGPAETIEQVENRVRHDLYYVDNWSLSLDIVILFKTVFGGFFGKNAF